MTRPHRRVVLLLLGLVWFLPVLSIGQTVGHEGMLVGWAIGKIDKEVNPQFGIRYIPEFTLEKSFASGNSLDAEFSLNGYATAQFQSGGDTQTRSELDLYRMWLRFSSSQFQARLGLQKINFGPAMLLRSLMWFDSLDPRDPLQLTDGVYSLLLRYYFLDNTNIWIWGLYGNDNPKGMEIAPTRKDSVEMGGRFQTPLGKGELALTYHHRRADFSQLPQIPNTPDVNSVPENRLALDGKWDVGVGLWFEAALIHQKHEIIAEPWRRSLTLGADYTFSWGNGLYVVAEYFTLDTAKDILGRGEGIQFAGLMLNYPTSILDTFNLIFFYDWDNRDLYSFVNWRRTYDHWSLNVMAYWNPDRFQIATAGPESNQFAGKGLQLMVSFNY